MKNSWENIESIFILLTGINFLIFWLILLRYAFASIRLNSMIEKIEKDGNLQDFSVSLAKYFFNWNQIEAMTFKIPTDIKYRQFALYQELVASIEKQRKLIRWIGIPLLCLVILDFAAIFAGFLD